MDAATVGYLSVIALCVFLAIGIPVATAMGIIGIVGMGMGAGWGFLAGQLGSLPYAVASNYAWAVLPMFVLMGVLAEKSGITEEIFRAADVWLRGIKGGLYQAVVVGSAIFAAISGSTIVNAIVFTRLAFPEMLKLGYSRSLSIGCIAASGSFAAMIPPSITMVIYAIICEQSVGQILIAGIVPGILTAIVYMIGLSLLVRFKPGLAPKMGLPSTVREKLGAIKWLWSVIAMVALVIGGMYAGWFPPSAAGAVGAFGVFVIFLLRRWKQSGKLLVEGLAEAASVTCIVFGVLIGGLLLSRMLVVLGLIDGFVAFFSAFASTPMQFMVLACIFYLLLGCFLDTTSMMVVTLPFIFPVVQQYKIDPIWFGIILVKLVEISVVTPPVGFNLFAVMATVDKQTSFKDLVRGVIPFIGFEFIVLAILLAFPELSTWLPQKMLNH